MADYDPKRPRRGADEDAPAPVDALIELAESAAATPPGATSSVPVGPAAAEAAEAPGPDAPDPDASPDSPTGAAGAMGEARILGAVALLAAIIVVVLLLRRRRR